MSKHTLTPEQITAKLRQPGPRLTSTPADRLPAPNVEMPIALTLEQLRPYDRNPRSLRNPKYDEIKDSIAAVGLKQSLTVTQRPGDDKYMISDGGNTRLAILNELYQETGDERFFRLNCHFIPWQGEINILAGHLAENDNRGQLSWIERARGVFEAKQMLEQEAGKPISQRELAKQLRELGYTVDHSHISRMLYTIEHFLPTLPITLESGIGQPQIKKLIAYRNYCEEFWNRCREYWAAHAQEPGQGQVWHDRLVHGDFAQAWHEEMIAFDHEGTTELDWKLVEQRLKGMLNDHTGVHYNVLDMTWMNWFAVRRGGSEITDEERADVWTTLDSELNEQRQPGEHRFFPPRPDEVKATPKRTRASSSDTSSGGQDLEQNQLGGKEEVEREIEFKEGKSDLNGRQSSGPANARGVPTAGGTGESLELQQLRARLLEAEAQRAELEERNAALEAGHASDDDDVFAGILDSDGLMRERASQQTRSPDEQGAIVEDLTLEHFEEPAGHRQLRHLMAQQHGEEAIDFDAAALKSVPLMSAGPIAPITDLWTVPTWQRVSAPLRTQIIDVVRGLAEWAGIEASGTSDVIRLNAHAGFGYELEPLADNASRRAQLVWQLLAGLKGECDPMLPADISLFGELIGGHGESEVRLPDGLLVRVWRLTRLIRVLRDTLELEKEERGNPQ